jgi:drug/metabolite transporter (DMT)-like permease
MNTVTAPRPPRRGASAAGSHRIHEHQHSTAGRACQSQIEAGPESSSQRGRFRQFTPVYVFNRIFLIDALLFLMALIWGTNYSIVKGALRDIDPLAFNALRMTIASVVFLAILLGLRLTAAAGNKERRGADSWSRVFRTTAAITNRDWLALAALGMIGHCIYQYCFIAGLAQTSVANSSLILAATPVLIALLSAGLGQERVSGLHWIGAALSMAGIYLVVGHGAGVAAQGASGDVLMVVAVCCWAVYTLASRALMTRHSPVGVTGLSMTLGTVMYVPATWTRLRVINWSAVSSTTWIALVYSALFALCVAYTIWYVAVQQIGSARTAVYSNLIPLIAMLTAVVLLGEPLGTTKIAGAGAVLAGVALTRIGGRQIAIPSNE